MCMVSGFAVKKTPKIFQGFTENKENIQGFTVNLKQNQNIQVCKQRQANHNTCGNVNQPIQYLMPIFHFSARDIFWDISLFTEPDKDKTRFNTTFPFFKQGIDKNIHKSTRNDKKSKNFGWNIFSLEWVR